jgi:hypothetical protein
MRKSAIKICVGAPMRKLLMMAIYASARRGSVCASGRLGGASVVLLPNVRCVKSADA